MTLSELAGWIGFAMGILGLAILAMAAYCREEDPIYCRTCKRVMVGRSVYDGPLLLGPEFGECEGCKEASHK